MFAGSLLCRGGWTPADLFKAGEFGFWYDINPKYLYQDSAGTVPAVVDSPVGLVLDRSGNERHGIQTDNGLRPTLRQSGGLYYLDQSTLNSHLVFGSAFVIPPQFYYAVGLNLNLDTTGIFFVGNPSYYYWLYQSGSTNNGINGANGTKLSIHVDGADLTSAITTRGGLYTALAGSNRVGVFGLSSTSLFFSTWNSGYYSAASLYSSQAHLYSIVCRDRMTANERQLLELYIAQKAGVVL